MSKNEYLKKKQEIDNKSKKPSIYGGRSRNIDPILPQGNLGMNHVEFLFQNLLQDKVVSGGNVGRSFGEVVMINSDTLREKIEAAILGIDAVEHSAKAPKAEYDRLLGNNRVLLLLDDGGQMPKNLQGDLSQGMESSKYNHWTVLNIRTEEGKNGGKEVIVKYANSIGKYNGRDEIPKIVLDAMQRVVAHQNRIKGSNGSEITLRVENFLSTPQTTLNCGYNTVYHALQMLGHSIADETIDQFIRRVKPSLIERFGEVRVLPREGSAELKEKEKKQEDRNIKPAQTSEKVANQIDQYIKSIEKLNKESPDYYIDVTAIYNFALALCKDQEKQEYLREYQEKAKGIEVILAKIELEFLNHVVIKENIAQQNNANHNKLSHPKTEGREQLEILNINRNQVSRQELGLIRKKTTEEIDKYSKVIRTEAPFKKRIIDETEEERSKRKNQDKIEKDFLLQLIREAKEGKNKEEIRNEEVIPKTSTQQIYRNCNQRLRKFITKIIKESKKDFVRVGINIPYECEYAIIALGSLSRDEATPYSDLEFGILIDDADQRTGIKYTEKQTEEIKEYFRNLTRLINIKVINLGETTPFIQAIKEVNDLGFESPMKNGFSFDSRRGIACKNPLGNGHVVNEEIEIIRVDEDLNDQEKEKRIKKVEGTRFELIGTPKELARFHNQEWFLRDNHITTVLFTAALLEGSNQKQVERIIGEYQKETDEVLDEEVSINSYLNRQSLASLALVSTSSNKLAKKPQAELDQLPTLRKQRSDLLLKEVLNQFEPSGGRLQERGRTFSPKYDFYRMANLVIDRLAYMYNVKASDVWGRFDKLFMGTMPNPTPLKLRIISEEERKFLLNNPAISDKMINILSSNKEGVGNLKWMLDRTLQIRLKNYMAKGAQDEDMIIFEYAKDDEERQKLTTQGYGITEKDVFEIYYVTLSFYEIVQKFINPQFNSETVFFDETCFDDSDFNRAKIHELLLNYDKAVEIYQRLLKIAESLNDKNSQKTLLNNLGNICSIRREAKGIDHFSEALRIDPNNPSILDNLAINYAQTGKNNIAIEYFEKSLKLKRGLYLLPKDDMSIADSLYHIGNCYSILGNSKKALKYLEKALSIYQKPHNKTDSDISRSLFSMSISFLKCGDFKKAESFCKQSLQIKQRINGSHDISIVSNLNNLGNIYETQDKYEEAAKFMELALTISRKVHGENHKDVKGITLSLIMIYQELGLKNGNLGKHKERISFLKKAILLIDDILKDPSKKATFLMNIGNSYAHIRDYDNAIKFLLEALSYISKEDRKKKALILFNLGYHNMLSGNREESINILKESVEIYSKYYPKDPNFIIAKNNFELAKKMHDENKVIFICPKEISKELFILQRFLRSKWSKYKEESIIEFHKSVSGFNVSISVSWLERTKLIEFISKELELTTEFLLNKVHIAHDSSQYKNKKKLNLEPEKYGDSKTENNKIVKPFPESRTARYLEESLERSLVEQNRELEHPRYTITLINSTKKAKILELLETIGGTEDDIEKIRESDWSQSYKVCLPSNKLIKPIREELGIDRRRVVINQEKKEALRDAIPNITIELDPQNLTKTLITFPKGDFNLRIVTDIIKGKSKKPDSKLESKTPQQDFPAANSKSREERQSQIIPLDHDLSYELIKTNGIAVTGTRGTNYVQWTINGTQYNHQLDPPAPLDPEGSYFVQHNGQRVDLKDYIAEQLIDQSPTKTTDTKHADNPSFLTQQDEEYDAALKIDMERAAVERKGSEQDLQEVDNSTSIASDQIAPSLQLTRDQNLSQNSQTSSATPTSSPSPNEILSSRIEVMSENLNESSK